MSLYAKIDQWFVRVYDIGTELGGRWQVLVASVLVVISWFIAGPLMNYSDTWQLLINTPTTILEMWLGFMVLGSSNRVQRKQDELMRLILQTLQEVKDLNEQQNAILTTLQAEQAEELAEEAAILSALAPKPE